jgi:hypothetical protein
MFKWPKRKRISLFENDFRFFLIELNQGKESSGYKKAYIK